MNKLKENKSVICEIRSISFEEKVGSIQLQNDPMATNMYI